MATELDENTEDLLQALEDELAAVAVDIKELQRKHEQLSKMSGKILAGKGEDIAVDIR